MANSDNVLRCGLTPKHIDVAELLKITDFTELAEPRWPARDGVFQVPVPEFALRRVDGAVELAGEGPRIVLCTEGTALGRRSCRSRRDMRRSSLPARRSRCAPTARRSSRPSADSPAIVARRAGSLVPTTLCFGIG